MKNVHKLQSVGHSDLIIYVCLALVSLYIYVNYEDFVINICRTGKYQENGCHLRVRSHQAKATSHMDAVIFHSAIHNKRCQGSKKKFAFAFVFAWCERSIKSICLIDHIFYVHILVAYVYTCARN